MANNPTHDHDGCIDCQRGEVRFTQRAVRGRHQHLLPDYLVCHCDDSDATESYVSDGSPTFDETLQPLVLPAPPSAPFLQEFICEVGKTEKLLEDTEPPCLDLTLSATQDDAEPHFPTLPPLEPRSWTFRAATEEKKPVDDQPPPKRVRFEQCVDVARMNRLAEQQLHDHFATVNHVVANCGDQQINFQADLALQEGAVRFLKQENTRLEKTIASLQAQINDLKKQKFTFEQANIQVEEENARLENDNTALKASFDSTREENVRLMRKVTSANIREAILENVVVATLAQAAAVGAEAAIPFP